ncbi:MAG TPA: D-alanyl-D-alanine carboxypeptidase [Peptococcaceae bacterium]|nr:D-alanyl-D-alanine carboxypeptidase [Peptococcaceae bacterium]
MKYKRTRVLICVFVFIFVFVFNSVFAGFAYWEIIFHVEPFQSLNNIENDGFSVETAKITGQSWTLPYVTAHSAILLDAQTGDILYERDAHQKRPPASTTKILTAILAIELADLEEIATVSEKADRVGESTIYLNKGDKLKLGELVEGALIRSGNDACVAIAEQTAGSHDEFVRLMNLKAISLGAYNSNFVNTNGLPANNHYSTAYDLAIIARYAMNNPIFSKIVAQKTTTISFEVPPKSQIATNTNKLLWIYPPADGVKTGTTNAAGKCLVASASKEGRRLICVVLNAPDRFGDAKRLLEWGFNETETVLFGKQGELITTYPGYGIPLILQEDLRICIEKAKVKNLKAQIVLEKDLYPPFKAGDVLGNYNIMLGERVLKTVPLLAGENYVGSALNFSGALNVVLEQVLDLLNKSR